MKLIKKRINLIAILMFIIFGMMLIMDFTNSFQENDQIVQTNTSTKENPCPILADFEKR